MPIYKKSFVALLMIAAAIFGGTIYNDSTREETASLEFAAKSDEATKNEEIATEDKTIFVYVTGGVNNPGMVELESDKTLRVADAVEACGGLLPTADTDNINLAATISDGEHIRIPEKSTEQSTQNQSVDSNISNVNNIKSIDSNGIVNINTATSEELQTLNGVGPKTAAKIIEYRQNNGAFKSIEEIQNVRGIGAKTFEKLKNRLKV